MSKKQELKQAQKRLLKAIAHNTTKAKLNQAEGNLGTYLEVKLRGKKTRYLLQSSSRSLLR